jgi:hypothetical protein
MRGRWYGGVKKVGVAEGVAIAVADVGAVAVLIGSTIGAVAVVVLTDSSEVETVMS